MFSGIIAAVGRITELTPRNDGTPTVRLTIDARRLSLDDVELGDSIACTGVCLIRSRHIAKVEKSWSSRSLRSVSTTNVGLAIAGCLTSCPA